MKLVIANKKYSSWSLRPWLLMKMLGIAFEEELIILQTQDTKDSIGKYSLAGKVPVLMDEGQVIHDSLAIIEYLHEKFPQKGIWPQGFMERAKARSISCEMHAEFPNLRTVMPHYVCGTLKGYDWSKAKEDVARVKQIWKTCLAASSGPFLFGSFSAADAMYAPVVNRFIAYDIPIEPELVDYMKRIRNLPEHQAWIQAAHDEEFVMPRYEDMWSGCKLLKVTQI